MDALLEPYKTENARLVRENNELHLGLLKLREEKDRLGRGTKLTTPTTPQQESDTTDRPFVINFLNV